MRPEPGNEADLFAGGLFDLPPAYCPHQGEQAAPVVNEDEDEETDEQRKRDRHGLRADDGRKDLAETFDQRFQDGLTAGRDNLRPADEPPDEENQEQGDQPARRHGVGYRKGAEIKQRLRLLGDATFGSKGYPAGRQEEAEENQFSD